jgi:hypothetical protein
LDDASLQHANSAARLKIGEVLAAGGDHEGALSEYREALPVFEEFAAADPGNSSRSLDLSLSHSRIGSALAAGGDHEGALRSHRTAFAIMKELADSDPGNIGWQ